MGLPDFLTENDLLYRANVHEAESINTFHAPLMVEETRKIVREYLAKLGISEVASPSSWPDCMPEGSGNNSSLHGGMLPDKNQAKQAIPLPKGVQEPANSWKSKTLESPAILPIGTRIRDARNAQGKTLEYVADSAHLDKSYLARIERNERGVRNGTLRRILDALHLNELPPSA